MNTPMPTDAIAALTAVLQAKRSFDPQNYMMPFEELVQEALPNAAERDDVLKSTKFGKQLVMADKSDPSSPVALKEDLEPFAASPALLAFAKTKAQQQSKDGSPLAIADLKKQVRQRDLAKLFENSLTQKIKAGEVQEIQLKKLNPKQQQEQRIKTLGENLIKVLRSQKELGPSAYPCTLQQLRQLTDPSAGDQEIMGVVGKKPFKDDAILLRKEIDSLVLLAGDEDSLRACPSLVSYLVNRARHAKDNPKKLLQNRAFTAAELKEFVTAKLQPIVGKILNERIGSGDLPMEVGALQVGRSLRLFLIEDLQPATLRERLQATPKPTPAGVKTDFAQRFEEAFQRLDRQHGGHNFVKLVDLRRELSEYPREEFDAGLQKLRIEKRYTLSGSQGKFGDNPAEREAAIHQAGEVLTTVSRRS